MPIVNPESAYRDSGTGLREAPDISGRSSKDRATGSKCHLGFTWKAVHSCTNNKLDHSDKSVQDREVS
ncbi:hypothetical protein SAMN05444398_101778 [Roseovarius pacificus]|uniref:Uncharacterized protein n=1 Tax=Roseovarius pacificus TaxID=337701 RepID=A0A1M6YAK1_9RHOB|nr:hypothetical protein GCM10011315_03480 [Roseovarius pacificus]SHL15316.1 hypothetical protein SAMN05444398_101778 [Roseovarius pacificus]